VQYCQSHMPSSSVSVGSGLHARAPDALLKTAVAAASPSSEKGVRLAQKKQVGPCIPAGIQP
jgi:hypothetical protein